MAKFYGYAQVFDSYAAEAKTTTFSLTSGVDGWGVNVGVGYGDFEGSRNADMTMDTWQTAVGYTYPLSRRTTLYTAADGITSDYSQAYKTAKPASSEDVMEFTVGIVHKF